MPTHIGPVSFDGVLMPTWLLRFDKRGACTSPTTRGQLMNTLRSSPPSDIFLFSHGWNNDYDDGSALYADFLRQFEAQVALHPLHRPFNPLFVGVIWPSIWLSFDHGLQIGAADVPVPDADSEIVQALTEKLASVRDSSSIERVYALLALSELDEAQARELATLIAPAFDTTGDEIVEDESGIMADELFRNLQATQRAEIGEGPGIDEWGVPGVDGPLEAAARAAEQPQIAGIFKLLDPRNALRLFSVYQMKDRAGTVGRSGIAQLMRDILASTQESRVHAVGHSYGCKVILSAASAPAPMPRPLSSLLLLQPAVSHLCFADEIPSSGRAGGYRPVLSPERALPPIISTYSKRDFALHKTFHLALRRGHDLGEIELGSAGDDTSAGRPPSQFAALGGYGPRRAGQHLVDPIPAPGTPYAFGFPPPPIIGVDGSGGLIGGHGDVASPVTAWALHQLVSR